MKKKIVTFALMATMVVGSVFSTFAAGSADTKDPEVEQATTNSSPDTNNTETTGAGVVSEEDIAAILAGYVLEGVEDGVELAVAAVAEDSEEYAAAEAFVKELNATAWAVLDLKLVKDNETIQPEAAVTVKMPIVTNLKDAEAVAVYRLDDATGEFVLLGKSTVGDGKIVFTTDHFSIYLFVEAEADVVTENPTTAGDDASADGKDPQTGDTAPIVPIVALAVVAVGAVVAVSAKKREA